MNRRGFLRWLGGTGAGAAAAHTLDLDKLLWVPGERKIWFPGQVERLSNNELGISIRMIRQWDISVDQHPTRWEFYVPTSMSA